MGGVGICVEFACFLVFKCCGLLVWFCLLLLLENIFNAVKISFIFGFIY